MWKTENKVGGQNWDWKSQPCGILCHVILLK
jgi:hypothetical protein